MNTFTFLQKNLLRRVGTDLTNDGIADVKRFMSSNHQRTEGNQSRLTKGHWMYVSDEQLLTNFNFKIMLDGAAVTKLTRTEVWLSKLTNFERPCCFIEFSKKPIQPANIFLTHDPRIVKICSEDAPEEFNFLAELTERSGVTERRLRKMLNDAA